MKRTEQEEIDELKKAVDFFAQAMKIKLIECAKAGKRGWDGEHPEMDLCAQISSDASTIYCEDGEEVSLSVDIANRAMMIWYRHYGKGLIRCN